MVRRVRAEVPAQLLWVLLFGSQARGEARPGSDVDLLWIFAALPPDREPHATHVELLTDEVARRTAVPLASWSVSAIDLRVGMRTPMLVDALADAALLWSGRPPPPRLPLTAADALQCTAALFDRVSEGAWEAGAALRAGDVAAAARRLRDDAVRLCTAALLLRGITRPRRADAALALLESGLCAGDAAVENLLLWTVSEFGPAGEDEHWPVSVPPCGFAAAFDALDTLHRCVDARARRLARA